MRHNNANTSSIDRISCVINTSNDNCTNKRAKMMLASASNLHRPQRRRLNCADPLDDEHDCFEPIKWSPTSSLDVTTDYLHCILKHRKRVTFHDPVVVSVISLDKMTEEEHKSVWYSREDYLSLQSAVRTAVKLFRKNNWTVTSKGQCRRGLEKYQLHYERKNMERQHFEAVLCEQQRQRELGIFDAELLHQASLINSTWALQNAHRSAMYDALACQQQHHQNQQQNYVVSHQDDSRTVMETLDSCDEGDDTDSDQRIDPELECFPHLSAFLAASRLPTPPPSPTNKHSHDGSPSRTSVPAATVLTLA